VRVKILARGELIKDGLLLNVAQTSCPMLLTFEKDKMIEVKTIKNPYLSRTTLSRLEQKQ